MLDAAKEKYNVKISMVILGSKSVWMSGNKKQAERLEWPVEKVFCTLNEIDSIYAGKKYVLFNISAETLDGDEASTPVLRYIIP